MLNFCISFFGIFSAFLPNSHHLKIDSEAKKDVNELELKIRHILLTSKYIDFRPKWKKNKKKFALFPFTLNGCYLKLRKIYAY